jgi:8-oxo-dGTP pyrophosphatase MutT (NUDIX family)
MKPSAIDQDAQALIALIESHALADAVEAAARQKMLDWLATAQRPLDRNSFDPGHATGSAFIVDRARQRVLLVFHGKLQIWLQPGGHAEAGENDIAAVARREAAEETGIVFDQREGRLFDLDVHPIPARKTEPEHLHFDFRFLFQADVGAIDKTAEVLEARWFTMQEALALPIDAGVRRMIRKAVGTWK